MTRLLLNDTETVGLNPPPAPASGVVEVAYLEIDEVTLAVKDEFYSRINPGCEIHPEASKVHGIYAHDVEDAPTLGQVFNPKEAVTSIGHNTSFDIKFLAPHYDNLAGQLCTLALARQYYPEAPNHKLGTLIEFLGLPKRDAHNALADCYMTHSLLMAIVEKSGRPLSAHLKAATKPKNVLKMPFGKFKGQPIFTLPEWYIAYFDDKEVHPDLRYSFDQARKARL
jgi:DNA polymerase III epsilon subunit-like protein